MRFPVIARTLDELELITTPAAVKGGNMEAFADELYDTQSYVAAGSTSLNFFRNPNADVTLSNMAQGGTMGSPEYFQIGYIRVVPILARSSATVPTNWANMETIMMTGRPVLTLNIMSKPYGPWHVYNMGVQGIQYSGYSDGAGAGIVSVQASQGGPDRSGFCVDGGLWLLPTANFNVNITWGNPAAVAADTYIRVGLVGTHYRAIR